MRRVKPAKSLESARFLLLKRRLQRHLPRHPARMLAMLSGITLAIIAVTGAVDRFDHGTRLQRAMLATTASLGLTVQSIDVEGRDQITDQEVLAAVGVARGEPLLGVVTAEAKAALEALPWVRTAQVERRLPDTLFIRLEERKPIAVWQIDGKQMLIDAEAKPITGDHLERYAGLPLVVGEGAAAHAQALFDLLKSEPDLLKRVSASIRVGDRRWRLRLDNGITVELPETGAEAAWHRLAQIEQGHALLARNIVSVDLRLADRVVLTPVPEPPKPAATKPARTKPTAKST